MKGNFEEEEERERPTKGSGQPFDVPVFQDYHALTHLALSTNMGLQPLKKAAATTVEFLNVESSVGGDFCLQKAISEKGAQLQREGGK